MTLARLSPVVAVLLLAASSAEAASVEGDWFTPRGGAKVHIAPCGGKLCGIITWLKNPNDKTGQPAKDAYNPDPALRGRPVIGLQVLRGLKPAGGDHWSGGSIYNPGDGKTYNSKMNLDAGGVLKVQGCVAIVCITQTWTRAS